MTRNKRRGNRVSGCTHGIAPVCFNFYLATFFNNNSRLLYRDTVGNVISMKFFKKRIHAVIKWLFETSQLSDVSSGVLSGYFFLEINKIQHTHSFPNKEPLYVSFNRRICKLNFLFHVSNPRKPFLVPAKTHLLLLNSTFRTAGISANPFTLE